MYFLCVCKDFFFNGVEFESWCIRIVSSAIMMLGLMGRFKMALRYVSPALLRPCFRQAIERGNTETTDLSAKMPWTNLKVNICPGKYFVMYVHGESDEWRLLCCLQYAHAQMSEKRHLSGGEGRGERGSKVMSDWLRQELTGLQSAAGFLCAVFLTFQTVFRYLTMWLKILFIYDVIQCRTTTISAVCLALQACRLRYQGLI